MDCLLTYWEKEESVFIKFFTFILVVITVIWLPHNFLKFIYGISPIWPFSEWAAGDLLLRYEEVRLWFSGKYIYGHMQKAVYPPASYVILCPLLIWQNMVFIKILWCLLYITSLCYLSYTFVKHSKTNLNITKILILLIPLSSYSAGNSLSIGQLTLLIIPCLIISVEGLSKSDSITKEVLYSLLFIFALVKPSVSAPFFLLILMLSRSFRPVFFIISGYLVLTVVAGYFQELSFYTLFINWLEVSSVALSNKGHMNVHTFLSNIGKEEWKMQVSLIILVLTGIWVFMNRDREIWLLIGVTAIISRFWVYHWWYDDVLMLLPIISLLVIVKSINIDVRHRNLASLLLIFNIISHTAPGGRYLLSESLQIFYIYFQFVSWISLFVFLLIITRNFKSRLVY